MIIKTRFIFNFLFISTILLSILLRFFYYDQSPPGLYTDEANQGFNAYALYQTGHDEHGDKWPISLRSFGDWKPPMQTWLSIPSIAVLGLNDYSVRFPSMVLGVLSLLLAFNLCKELKFSSKYALLVLFFLSISPWHIHQSRSAMLVLVALFFFLLGLVKSLEFIRKGKGGYIAAVGYAAAVYSYYGMRLIVPLTLVLLAIFYFKDLRQRFGKIIYPSLLFILLMAPIGLSFIQNPDVVFGRAKSISIFHDQGIVLRIWELHAQEGPDRALLARSLHNKVYLYTIDIIRRLIQHVDPQFLIVTGDNAPPFDIPNMGVLYFLDYGLLLVGVVLMVKSRPKTAYLLLSLLGICIFPAALTFMTPTANRTFTAIVPFILFVTYAVFSLNKIKRKHIVLSVCIVVVYIVQNIFYLYQYYKVLPLTLSEQWAYGYKQMVAKVHQKEEKYDTIVILPKSNIAYIYFLFYDPKNSMKNLSLVQRDYTADEFGFEHVSKMGKYTFARNGSYEEIKQKSSAKTLFVGVPEEIPAEERIDFVKDLNDKNVFVFSQRL